MADTVRGGEVANLPVLAAPGSGHASDAGRYPAEQLLTAAHGGYRPPAAPPEPAARNAPAVQALVFGAISLLVNFGGLVSVAAIVWGVIGINRANQMAAQGRPVTGTAMATWGLVLGGAGLGFTVLAKDMMF